MLRQRLRPLFALLAVAATLAFVAAEADAAPRFNAGSRGSRTFSAPAATATAPNAARPIQRSATQPGAATAARPGAAAAAPGGFLSRPGLLGGLAAGFLGAGLFGMLAGHGLFGGLGGLASMFGLLLQIGIVVLVARMAWKWWQRRNQPSFAGGPSGDHANHQRPSGMAFNGLGGGLSGMFGGGASQPANDVPVEIKPEDFDAFEKLLGEVQTAYGREDITALRAHVTPEMLSYYAEELAQNTSRGVVNQLSNIKLLQGDLAESWSEGTDEYATVAMRYSLDDRYVDRASGKVVEDQTGSEATELWTFRRARGGDWVLSAIQQA